MPTCHRAIPTLDRQVILCQNGPTISSCKINFLQQRKKLSRLVQRHRLYIKLIGKRPMTRYISSVCQQSVVYKPYLKATDHALPKYYIIISYSLPAKVLHNNFPYSGQALNKYLSCTAQVLFKYIGTMHCPSTVQVYRYHALSKYRTSTEEALTLHCSRTAQVFPKYLLHISRSSTAQVDNQMR